MPRGPRLQIHGAYYHVYARGNRRQSIFVDDEDRRELVHLLARAALSSGACLVAYCLMPNHFHLLLQPGDAGLPRFMHRVLCAYASWYNRRHSAVGHLFQGRYGSRPIESAGDLLTVLRYVHLNPVAARLADDPARWQWSSHRFHLSERPPELLARGVASVREILGPPGREGIDRYRELMALPMPGHQEIFDRVAPTPENCLLRSRTASQAPPSIERLLDETARQHGVSRDELTGGSRRRRLVAAKRAFARKAHDVHGHPLSSIARVLGCSPQAIHGLLYVPGGAVELRPEARAATSPAGES